MMQSMEKLQARGEVYEFLAKAYYSPEAAALRDRCSAVRDVLEMLELPLLVNELEKMATYLQAVAEPLELSLEYTRLFRGPVKAAVYPYESMNVDGEIMGISALDVVGCYLEAGVEVSAEFKDLPDHICAEAEFMRYLCAWEVDVFRAGDADRASRIHLMQRYFLRDHIARWWPQFARRVREQTNVPFYSGLAKITEDFINWDVANDQGPFPMNLEESGCPS